MIASGRKITNNGVQPNSSLEGAEMEKNNRVCVFVDNTNFFHAQRIMKNEVGEEKRLDYLMLKDILEGDELRFYYSSDEGFVPNNDDSWGKKQGRDKFYGFLQHQAGFTMVKLPLRQRTDFDPGTNSILSFLNKKGYSDDEILRIIHQKPSWLRRVRGGQMPEEKGLDCEIVYDMSMLARTGRYDTFVVVAGDEDYARSVSRIPKETGVKVKVAFFGNLCSNFLKESCSEFIDLRDYHDLYKTVAPFHYVDHSGDFQAPLAS
jgi:uncharacterized LabA/DUF88 family protein